jgi:predicted metal-binding membrane protein
VILHPSASTLGWPRHAPLGFLMIEWREGAGGAMGMGLRPGWNWVGCCWALLLVPFSVGVI